MSLTIKDKMFFGSTFVLLIGGIFFLTQMGASGIAMPFNAISKCDKFSGYVFDSNVSYSGLGERNIYLFGKCYIETCTMDGYETREVCRGGLLGIGMSCYEASEPHYESFRLCRTKCYIAKTGEKCEA